MTAYICIYDTYMTYLLIIMPVLIYIPQSLIYDIYISIIIMTVLVYIPQNFIAVTTL